MTSTPSLDETTVLDEIEVLAGDALEPDVAREARRRRMLVAGSLLVFVLTRAAAGYVADHPGFYGPHRADGTGDVYLYDQYTWDMRHLGANAYRDLRVEYPPGAIPVLMVPRYVRAVSYRTEFIVLMMGFDALGLWGLVRIACRGGSWWGAATWLALVPLLGVVSYTRFDMVVAVALVWALERARAGKWKQTGALLAVGAAVKLVPVALVPLVYFVAPRRQRRGFLLTTAGVIALTLVPFAFELPDLWQSVIHYHAARGVQAESVWGAALLVARRLAEYPVRVVASHRAYDAVSSVSATLKTVSNLLCVAALLATTGLAARTRRSDVARLSVLLFGSLTLLIGLGSVYSPQYLLWVIGLGAAAMALAPRRTAPAVAVLAVTVALAQLEFPMWFWDVLFFDKGGALVDLVARDVLTIGGGLVGLWCWRRAAAGCLTPSA